MPDLVVGKVTVPDPTGLDLQTYLSLLNDNELLGNVSLIPSATIDEGFVISVSPTGDVDPGTTIAVVYSSGVSTGTPFTPPPPPTVITPPTPQIQNPGAIVARLASVQLSLSDVSHFWGQDLAVSNTQDIDLVTGTVWGQQKVLRRLLTNPGDYLFQPDYGAGLPAYVGQTTDVAKITALIKSQIALESVVAPTPAPVITVSNAANSTDASALAITIAYTDAPTGSAQVLSFSLSK